MVKCKGYCKKASINKSDGKAPLYITMRAPGQNVVNISIGKRIDPSNFDNNLGVYSNRTQESLKINALIGYTLEKIDNIKYQLEKEGLPVNYSNIKARFLNASASSSFVEFAEYQLEKLKHLMKPPTYNDYAHCLKNFRKYAPKVTFSEMSTDYLDDYKNYLLHVEKRKPNGIYHEFATIRKFWNIALKKNVVSTNPFSDFKMPKEKTQPVFLVKDELETIWRLWNSHALKDSLQGSLYWFLFACYTGWRYSDVKQFSVWAIADKSVIDVHLKDGNLRIKTSKSNGRKEAKIPIKSKNLIALLQHLPDRPIKQSKWRIKNDMQLVFEIVGINKNIGFHGTRHTFAVVCKQLGIDTAVLRDLLTHSSIVTTEIYEEITDDLLDNSMEKWNE